MATQTGAQRETGCAHPHGATPDRGGVNVSLFSENTTAVELLLFRRHDDSDPSLAIKLDPYVNQTFRFWHVCVNGLAPGTHYAYRVDGAFDLIAGNRYNPPQVLTGPHAKGNTEALWNRANPCGPDDNFRVRDTLSLVCARPSASVGEE
jgi:isoamylase